MRLLLIHPPGNVFQNMGGIQTYVREVEAALRARGHEVASIGFDPPAVMANLGWRDYLPLWACRDRYYFWRTSYLDDYRYHGHLHRHTLKAISELRPQLVHAFHTYQFGALLASDAPTVVTCHGLEIVDIPPVRGSLTIASGIHANSRFTRRRVEDFMGPQAKIRVHSWGIKTVTHAKSGYDFDLITLGRVVRRKNIDTVLRVLARHPEWNYAVVGDGPEVPRLKELAARLGLTNVDFLGRVDDREKTRLLARSRLFVMCPRKDDDADVEGLGLVYYEAHGAGVPAVGARSGGVAEAIGEGGTLIDDPLDVAELEAALLDALEPHAFARLKEAVNVRQRNHSWEGFIDGLESWYQELLK